MVFHERCAYCGDLLEINDMTREDHRKEAVFDHVIPHYHNANPLYANDRYNQIPCCRHCNSAKGHKTMQEWRLAYVRSCLNVPWMPSPVKIYLHHRYGIDIDRNILTDVLSAVPNMGRFYYETIAYDRDLLIRAFPRMYLGANFLDHLLKPGCRSWTLSLAESGTPANIIKCLH